MSPERGSIASRARRYVVAATVLAVAVSALAFYLAWSAYVVEVRTAELARQAAALASGLDVREQMQASANAGGLAESLFRVQARLLGTVLYTTDADGAIERSSAGGATGELPVADLAPRRGSDVRAGVRDLRTTRVVIVAAPLASGGWLVAVQPLREVRQAQQGIAVLLASSLGLAFVLAWITGWLLARRLARPLVRLRTAAEDVAAGGWGRQVEVEGDSEIASLAESFNTMSTAVSSAYERQKEFVGDVSHELRTPITAIRGWAGALQDGTAAQPEQRERALQAIAEEADRLADLTETLLTLADLDAGRGGFSIVPTDLARTIDALVARHSLAAAGAGVGLVAGASVAGARVLADPERLLQAMSALVDNAIAYTPAGGEVLVSAEVRAARVLLTVDDTGPGISPEDREAVFARFTRLERSRSTRGGGSGLGLSLCRKLVELMGGSVRATDSPLGGARFEIELPLAPFDSPAA